MILRRRVDGFVKMRMTAITVMVMSLPTCLECLDFYMRHCIAGDQHIRIYEHGSSERLETIFFFRRSCPDDPVRDAELKAEDQTEVERIRALLRAKGLDSSY